MIKTGSQNIKAIFDPFSSFCLYMSILWFACITMLMSQTLFLVPSLKKYVLLLVSRRIHKVYFLSTRMFIEKKTDLDEIHIKQIMLL